MFLRREPLLVVCSLMVAMGWAPSSAIAQAASASLPSEQSKNKFAPGIHRGPGKTGQGGTGSGASPGPGSGSGMGSAGSDHSGNGGQSHSGGRGGTNNSGSTGTTGR
jgi:hypothetical protein